MVQVTGAPALEQYALGFNKANTTLEQAKNTLLSQLANYDASAKPYTDVSNAALNQMRQLAGLGADITSPTNQLVSQLNNLNLSNLPPQVANYYAGLQNQLQQFGSLRDSSARTALKNSLLEGLNNAKQAALANVTPGQVSTGLNLDAATTSLYDRLTNAKKALPAGFNVGAVPTQAQFIKPRTGEYGQVIAGPHDLDKLTKLAPQNSQEAIDFVLKNPSLFTSDQLQRAYNQAASYQLQGDNLWNAGGNFRPMADQYWDKLKGIVQSPMGQAIGYMDTARAIANFQDPRFRQETQDEALSRVNSQLSGLDSVNTLLSGISTEDANPWTQSMITENIMSTPGYKEQFDQGMQAFKRQQAATGGLRSGNAILGAQDFGSQFFNKAYTDKMNNLATAVGFGTPFAQAQAQIAPQVAELRTQAQLAPSLNYSQYQQSRGTLLGNVANQNANYALQNYANMRNVAAAGSGY